MISSMENAETGCAFEENLAALLDVPLFGALPLEAVKALAWLCHRSRYGAGEALFAQGETDDKAYVLLAGRAEVVRAEPDGGERVLGEMGEGECVGALALAGDVPRLFTLRAAGPLTALVLPRERFLSGLGAGREASPLFLEALARRVVRWEESILRRPDSGKTGLDEVGVSLV